MSILAVIPARYASVRFPGKPLADIQGKPMIRHVWERVSAVTGIARCIIATDDARIRDAALAFGADVAMTAAGHPSGTDRVWEVARDMPGYDWILNVQGDEPFIDPTHLEAVMTATKASEADILTLVTPLTDAGAWRDPNIVKAALAENSRALYFSRAAIPFHRDKAEVPERVFRHIGLYCYRREALARLTALPPSPLEQIEKLEQLRALEAGMRIDAMTVDRAPIGIDTPEDLERLRQQLPSSPAV